MFKYSFHKEQSIKYRIYKFHIFIVIFLFELYEKCVVSNRIRYGFTNAMQRGLVDV